MLCLSGNDELLNENIVNFDAGGRTLNDSFFGFEGHFEPFLQNLVQIVDSYHLPNA